MAATVEFRQQLPVRHCVDVVVAGGGAAGVAAGVTAARTGARVLLIEGDSCFGGMGTAGLLPIFCWFTDGVHFLAGGFGREIYDRLWDAGGTGPDDVRDSFEDNVTIRAEVLKRVYDDVIEESGCQALLMTRCLGLARDGDRLTHLYCSGKSGLFAVKASMFIDCTGDGDLVAWAGAPFHKGDQQGRMMAGTLCSVWTQVDWEAAKHANRQAAHQLPRAFADGVFSVNDPHLPGMWRISETMASGNLGHIFGLDGTDEASLTTSLIRARRMMLEYERFYKNYVDGFGKMELAMTAPKLGVRETRRIIGDYVLTVEDFHRRASFPDEIGRFAYPIDVHASSPDARSIRKAAEDFRNLRYQPGESYGIPYRCLLPQGISNLLVAGRCVSADRGLLGSIRVMPGCFITGQAAGMAAALAVRHRTHTRGICVEELQERLLAIGHYLPNVQKSPRSQPRT